MTHDFPGVCHGNLCECAGGGGKNPWQDYIPTIVMAGSITLIALALTITYCSLVWQSQTVYSLFFVLSFIVMVLPYSFVYLLVSADLLSGFVRDCWGRRNWVGILSILPIWCICLACVPVLIDAVSYLPRVEKMAGDVRTNFNGERVFSKGSIPLNGRIRLLLSNNINTPQDILDELSKDKRVSLSVAMNPAVSVNTLTALAQNPRADIKKAVALNPAASCDILTMLSTDSDMEVRKIAVAVLAERAGVMPSAPLPVAVTWKFKPSAERCH